MTSRIVATGFASSAASHTFKAKPRLLIRRNVFRKTVQQNSIKANTYTADYPKKRSVKWLNFKSSTSCRRKRMPKYAKYNNAQDIS